MPNNDMPVCLCCYVDYANELLTIIPFNYTLNMSNWSVQFIYFTHRMCKFPAAKTMEVYE